MFTAKLLLEDANVFASARAMCGYRKLTDLANEAHCTASAISRIETSNYSAELRRSIVFKIFMPKLRELGFWQEAPHQDRILDGVEKALHELGGTVSRHNDGSFGFDIEESHYSVSVEISELPF
jgi:hypothetical protein